MKRVTLRRGRPLTRSTPLPAVSAKQARRLRARTVVLRPLREAQPWCARCGQTGVGLDAHEKVRRSQYKDAATDLAVIVLLCRPCHRFITESPQAGHDEGWVIWGWELRAI